MGKELTEEEKKEIDRRIRVMENGLFKELIVQEEEKE